MSTRQHPLSYCPFLLLFLSHMAMLVGRLRIQGNSNRDLYTMQCHVFSSFRLEVTYDPSFLITFIDTKLIFQIVYIYLQN